MANLEDLTPGSEVWGIVPGQLATVIAVDRHGSNALAVNHKTASGEPSDRLLYRDDESLSEAAAEGQPWSFDGDGGLFRLVSEAPQRIHWAHLQSFGNRVGLGSFEEGSA